jgi:hypothetical protein
VGRGLCGSLASTTGPSSPGWRWCAVRSARLGDTRCHSGVAPLRAQPLIRQRTGCRCSRMRKLNDSAGGRLACAGGRRWQDGHRRRSRHVGSVSVSASERGDRAPRCPGLALAPRGGQNGARTAPPRGAEQHGARAPLRRRAGRRHWPRWDALAKHDWTEAEADALDECGCGQRTLRRRMAARPRSRVRSDHARIAGARGDPATAARDLRGGAPPPRPVRMRRAASVVRANRELTSHTLSAFGS